MHTKMILAVVGVAAIASLAACSSTGSDTTTPDVTTTESAAPVELGTLNTIQSVSKQFASSGMDLATEHGSWPDGLTVVQTVSGKVAEAFAAGDADVGNTSAGRLLSALSQGLPVTIVGTADQHWDQIMIASPEYAGKKLADLKGGTFGVTSNGSAGDLTVRSVAKGLGWSDTDYSTVTLGDIAGMVAALKSGQIDAFPWGMTPLIYELEQDGTGVVLGSTDQYLQQPTSLIIASNEVLASRPAAVKAFCETYYSENRWMIDNPDEAAKVFAGWDDVSIEAAAAAVDYYIDHEQLATDPSISDAGFQGMVNSAAILGIEGFPDVDSIKAHYKSCYEL